MRKTLSVFVVLLVILLIQGCGSEGDSQNVAGQGAGETRTTRRAAWDAAHPKQAPQNP